jgi:hypothetical protein
MQNAPVLCQNKSSLTDLANDLFIYVPVEVIPAIPPKFFMHFISTWFKRCPCKLDETMKTKTGT